MALKYTCVRLAHLLRGAAKVYRPRGVASAVIVLSSGVAKIKKIKRSVLCRLHNFDSTEASKHARSQEMHRNLLEIRHIPCNHSGCSFAWGVVRQRGVRSARRDVLVCKPHEILVLAPELGEPEACLVLRNVVAVVELLLEPCQKADLYMNKGNKNPLHQGQRK
jgi:hypothetical protein